MLVLPVSWQSLCSIADSKHLCVCPCLRTFPLSVAHGDRALGRKVGPSCRGLPLASDRPAQKGSVDTSGVVARGGGEGGWRGGVGWEGPEGDSFTISAELGDGGRQGGRGLTRPQGQETPPHPAASSSSSPFTGLFFRTGLPHRMFGVGQWMPASCAGAVKARPSTQHR